MSNDLEFDAQVHSPAYEIGKGPKILLDAAHYNFFTQWDFMKPFSMLAKADGYQPIVGSSAFTAEYLAGFDIVLIITALPFDFTTKTEVTDEVTFSQEEISHLYQWGNKGGLENEHPKIKGRTKQAAGMNLKEYDWKQFALNTLHWLSVE